MTCFNNNKKTPSENLFSFSNHQLQVRVHPRLFFHHNTNRPKINARPVIVQLLTTMSWHPPPAVGSCRRGRRLPAADVGQHRFVFSGQACCPWSAASPPHAVFLGESAVLSRHGEENEEASQRSALLGLLVWTSQTHLCPVFCPSFFYSPLVFHPTLSFL